MELRIDVASETTKQHVWFTSTVKLQEYEDNYQLCRPNIPTNYKLPVS